MKKLFFLMLAISIWLNPAHAQVSVNLNLGAQPQWGPSGYNRADYYYLPDIQTYYNVPQKQFIYRNNDTWAFSNSLPARYNGYNLYNGYKVVLNTPKPYLYFNDHKVKYAKYKGVKGKQATLKSKNYGQAKKTSYAGSIKANNNQGNQGNGNNGNGHSGKSNGKAKGKH